MTDPQVITPLPGLPGAGHEPGTGVVVEPLLDGLLADVLPAAAVPSSDPTVGVDQLDADHVVIAAGTARAALDAHLAHRAAWYGDLLGPLHVPAGAVHTLTPILGGSDHGLRLLLVLDAPDPRASWAARAALIDDDRVDLVGLELPLAGPDRIPAPAAAAAAALGVLDASVPAWIRVPVGGGWEPALDVLAADGAENVALRLGRPDEVPAADLATSVRAIVDRELTFAVTGGDVRLATTGQAYGLLNLIGAVRAALNGAEVPELAAILAERSPAPLVSAARRMSEADAAVLRSFLPVVAVDAVLPLVTDLEAAGLIAPDAAWPHG